MFKVLKRIFESNKNTDIKETEKDIIGRYISGHSFKPLSPSPDNAAFLILKGICVGDIFGQPYEMTGFDGDPDTVNPLKWPESHYTDDTIMAFAVYEATKEALSHPEWTDDEITDSYAASMKKWAKKYPSAGYGNSFYDWAVCDEDDPDYKSFGNGSAMRSGTIGALCDTFEDTVKYAVLSAMPTHSHPEGIKGSVVTAVSVWLGLHGYGKDDILQYALDLYKNGFKTNDERYNGPFSRPNMDMSPNITMDQLIKLGSGTISVTCQVSVPEAIANFMHSDDFESCIRNCLRYPCDSDTIGAISGGIAAAFYKNTEFKDTDVGSVLKEKMRPFYMDKTGADIK